LAVAWLANRAKEHFERRRFSHPHLSRL
jgi:hypothetical protein